jgi:hypothetical protein
MRMLVVIFLAGCSGVIGGDPQSKHKPQPDMAAPPDLAEAPADLNCGGSQFALTRVSPNVMLVLDRSGSMGDSIGGGSATSKWDDLKSAISLLVTGYDAKLRLGASLFSSNGDCAAGTVMAPADMNGATVLAAVTGSSPGGNTPTAGTLQAVIDSKYLTDATRDNVVVLATDGLPNCGDTDVEGRISTLYAATPSVKTYVIGVGDATASDPTLLDSWAAAGHTARSGSPTYYQASSPTDLTMAFDAIAAGLVSCSFALSSVPPDPMQLYVWSNGASVAQDPTDGFTYDSGANTVVLHGASCQTLQSNPATKIQVSYGCPTAPIN